MPQSSQKSKSELHQRVIINRAGKIERVFVALELVYPIPDDPRQELSFEELRAQRRGLLKRDFGAERKQEYVDPTLHDGNGSHLSTSSSPPNTVALAINEENDVPIRESTSRPTTSDGKSKKIRVMEVKSEPQTVQTKLESPSGPKKAVRKNSSSGNTEPTMTFHTRAATDEIYSIFNQPLQSNAINEDHETDGTDAEDDEDDYTTDGESTGTGRFDRTSEIGDTENETEVKSVSEWSEFTGRKHIPNLDEDDATGDASRIEGPEQTDAVSEQLKDAQEVSQGLQR
jgi:checkpoint serine/threonine-protein kinase